MAKIKNVKSIDFTGLSIKNKGAGKIAVSLGEGESGVLPVGSGGTGLNTAAADNVLTGNGTNALTSESTLTYNETDGLKVTSASASKPIMHLQNSHSGATGGILKFEKTTTDESTSDVLGNIEFYGKNSNGDTIKYAYIDVKSSGVTDGDEKGEVRVYVADQNEGETLALIVRASGDDQAEVVLGNGEGANTVYGASTSLLSDTSAAPLFYLSNTGSSNSVGPTLVFQLQARTGTADDTVGVIKFTGKDAGDNTQDYAKILVKSKVVVDGQEGGYFAIQVPAHDGTLTNGLILEDMTTSAAGTVNATVGAGSISKVTVPGTILCQGGNLDVIAGEGSSASIDISADEGDDAGDTWTIEALTNSRLSFSNDIASKGTPVAHMTITPGDPATDSSVGFTGTASLSGTYFALNRAGGHIVFAEGSSAPDHASAKGKLWVKNTVPAHLMYTDDVGNDIDITTPPGTILGYREQTAADSYTCTTSFASIVGSGVGTATYVTFTTPPSEVVKIDFQCYLDEGSGATSTYLGLSDALSYNTVNVRFEKLVLTGSRRDTIIHMSWILTASYLAAIGSSNTIYIGAKASTDETFRWGGTSSGDHPSQIVTATAL